MFLTFCSKVLYLKSVSIAIKTIDKPSELKQYFQEIHHSNLGWLLMYSCCLLLPDFRMEMLQYRQIQKLMRMENQVRATEDKDLQEVDVKS